MFPKILNTLVALLFIVASTSCAPTQTTPTPQTNLPNPASVYCEENGGKLELRQDSSGGVAGVCVFPDGSECDEWAYFRGECRPAGLDPAQDAVRAPTEIPTALPIDPADYAGWWTYTHPVYGFSLQLPLDWVVDETTANDVLMNGHLLMVHPQSTVENLSIRMTFRTVGEEDVLLWPTGVGEGEFVEQGTLDIAGQPAQRLLFVCPSGQINEIWYHGAAGSPNIQRGNMEFGFILAQGEVHCQEGYSLGGKIQRLGEMVIASLTMP